MSKSYKAIDVALLIVSTFIDHKIYVNSYRLQRILYLLYKDYYKNITYKDRLTRFGFSYFENLFKKFNCEIVVLNSTSETTFEQELTQDLISIIHHFSMKMYSNRRNKLKKIIGIRK